MMMMMLMMIMMMMMMMMMMNRMEELKSEMENIKIPLFILHGEKDTICTISGSR